MVKTAAELARVYGVSRQTVQDWKVAGMPWGRGGFDLFAVGDWRATRTAEKEKPVGDKMDPDERRKLRAEADIKEATARRIIGELIEKSAVFNSLSSLVAMIRSRLQAIPGELAGSIPPDLRHDLVIDLETKIGLILTEMSGWQLIAESSSKRQSGRLPKSGGPRKKRGGSGKRAKGSGRRKSPMG